MARNFKFQFAGKIARLLGRESVSNPIIALFELIKNSYDADAKEVIINLINPKDKDNAIIEIFDNGVGMSVEEFIKNWMVVGTDNKELEKITTQGRRKVGEKGLGRFSIEKLGRNVEIITKKENSDTELKVFIDWDLFEKPGVTFDNVDIFHEETKSTTSWKGFKIRITKLRDVWTEERVKEFIEEVSILTPPKEIGSDFKVVVSCTDYGLKNYSEQNYLFNEAKYLFEAKYDGKGNIKYKIKGRSIYGIDYDIYEEGTVGDLELKCGEIDFILYFYNLDVSTDKFYPEQQRQQISKDLKEVSGIKIYRDGFRVKPYGDKGNDWMQLSYKRLQLRHIKYPDNKQIIGYTSITRDKNLIEDTTTREGLIKNEAYYDMIEFLEHSLRIFASFRKKNEKNKDPDFDGKAKLVKANINLKLEKSKLPEKEKKSIVKEFNKIIKEANQEIEVEKEKKELYRNLATLGITAGYTAHEIRPIISRMNTQIDFLFEEDVILNDKNIKKRLDTLVQLLEDNETYIDLVIGYIKKDKRKRKLVDIEETLNYILDHFSFILKKFNIVVEVKNKLNLTGYKLFRIDLESIFINLLLNSIYFLKYKDKNNRNILVEIEDNENFLFIKFHDSGKGIVKENKSKIFEPLFTTKPSEEGTGLGLTIVSELVVYYGGKVEVIEPPLQGFSVLITLNKDTLK